MLELECSGGAFQDLDPIPGRILGVFMENDEPRRDDRPQGIQGVPAPKRLPTPEPTPVPLTAAG